MDRARHARHLLLSEVGPAGQERLCAHEATVTGDPRAASVAATYLERAGIRLGTTNFEPRRTQRTRRGQNKFPSVSSVSSVVKIPAEEVATLAGREELAEAAAWLLGAFEAVEEIKRALEVGRPGSLAGVRLSGPEGDGGE